MKTLMGCQWIGLMIAAMGCSTSNNGPVTKLGITASVYNSTVQPYTILTNGIVTEVGFTFPQAAATAAAGQPAGTVDGWNANYPAEAGEQTVVNHFLLDFFHDGISAPWNQAFFGVHFYFLDQPTRLQVTCPETGAVAAGAVPAMYSMLDNCTFGTSPSCGCIAGEGVHAVDASAPEMQTPAGAFTHNFWLGYHADQMAFFEPFITASFLEASAGFDDDIRQPTVYPSDLSGKLFPTKFSAALANGTWTISVHDFIDIP